MSALMLQSSLKQGADSPLASFGYSLVETLAGGHYGIIHKAKCQVSRQTVIVKELDCSTYNLSRSSAREALIMRELDHQHVVSLHFDIKLGNRLFLVMQHAQGGDLHEYITSSPDGHLSVPEAKRVFAQVISGLEHMHSRNIVHGDIKPDNIFLDQDNNALIGDMGLSGVFKPKSKSYVATGGTVHYSAPETFCDDSMVNGPELDIWSAGVLLYVMLRGRYPFWAENDQDLALAISTCEPYWPEWFPAEAIDLISQMTHKKSSKRISLSKIKKHAFIKDEYRKLSRKLRRSSSCA